MRELLLFIAAILALPGSSWADTFGSGDNAFEIEFVSVPSVGSYEVRRCRRCPVEVIPGNRPDAVPLRTVGSVPYSFQIGKYEISEAMIDAANALGNLGISHDNRGPEKPATNVTWSDAARFVNWLNEDQGFPAAYKFAVNNEFLEWEPGEPGYNPDNVVRNSRARYVLPNHDEWHKAAYYDPIADDYYQFPIGPGDPTAVISGTDPGTAVFNLSINDPIGPANIMQAGGLSPYGTMAQGGNVGEWHEAPSTGRGGFWASSSSALSSSSTARGNMMPNQGFFNVGFRVAFVPEPTSGALSLFAMLLAVYRSRKCTYAVR